MAEQYEELKGVVETAEEAIEIMNAKSNTHESFLKVTITIFKLMIPLQLCSLLIVRK